MIRMILVFSVLAAVQSTTAKFALAAEIDSASRVRTKYPEALVRLESAYKQTAGKCVCSYLMNKKYSKFNVNFNFDRELRKVEVKYVGEPAPPEYPTDRVFCLGKTPFVLNRRQGSPSYFLANRGDPGACEHSIGFYARRFLDAPFSFNGILMSDIISDPSFKIVAVKSERIGDSDCLKIQFKYDSKTNGLGDGWDGWVVVDPDQGWIIRKGECGVKSDPTFRITMSVDYIKP